MLKIDIKSGKYVLAVSGGVDSMTLMDILARKPVVEVVVAHFNHGIRPDSLKDEELVVAIAEEHGLLKEVGYGELGPTASEEQARDARYKFLELVKVKHQAIAIITAHHQDDLIETAFLNLLRGSGRRGLSAITASGILRPLLGTPKTEILKYAQEHRLIWREDTTNSDTTNPRNYLRHKVLPALSEKDRVNAISNLDKVAKINNKLNTEIATLSQTIKSKGRIDRAKFVQLPGDIANEAVMLWLREYKVRKFDKKTVNRLSMAIKTSLPNTEQPVAGNLKLKIGQKSVHFSNR